MVVLGTANAAEEPFSNKDKYDYEAYEFRIDIDYVAHGEFKAVEGSRPELEVAEFEDGGELLLRMKKQLARPKITGTTFNRNPTWEPLWFWLQECVAGECARKTISVHSFDDSLTPTGTWELTDAFLKSIADDSDFEEVTFKFNQIEFIEPE